MPKQKTEDLIALIRSLSRAEKRHFRLFVRRNQSGDNILFLQLFDYLDRQKAYDEAHLLKRLPAIKKTQLSNQKAHLYKQLLTSLRLLNNQANEEVVIREHIDNAHVLYDKGLYRQALESLDKAKQRARHCELYTLALEIVEFEKLIEGQYITRSIEGRAQELANETLELSDYNYQRNRFSNLSLQLYGLYLEVGYTRDERDHCRVREFFERERPRVNLEALDFWGKVYYFQSYLWYHHTVQDFRMSYLYAQRWVNLFLNRPEMIQVNPPLYLKGLNNLLGELFNVLRYDRFLETLQLLEQFPDQYDLSRDSNVEGLYNLYRSTHTLKRHFMEGTFTEGLRLVPDLVHYIEENTYHWDEHRIMLFYYRIACLYFGAGDNDRAIDFLNLIINQRNPSYRNDIQAFARILNLIAHFELGNAQLVEYQVKSVYRFLLKLQDLHEVQRAIFQFLRRTPRMQEEALPEAFRQLRDQLVELEKDPYQRRPFLYLDIISWLESRLQGVAVQEIIRQRFLERRRLRR